jgi:hypothetical protein
MSTAAKLRRLADVVELVEAYGCFVIGADIDFGGPRIHIRDRESRALGKRPVSIERLRNREIEYEQHTVEINGVRVFWLTNSQPLAQEVAA